MDGFSFASIVVRRGDEAVLMLPLFDVRFRLASLVDGAAGRIVRGVAKVLPGVMAPRLLGVGLVEGEWGQAGIAGDVDGETIAEAWKLAAAAMWAEAKKRRAALVVFLNFTPGAVAALPAGLAGRMAGIDTIPCARLPITFASVDEYLQGLSKSTRKDLRRKLKSAEEIEIVHSTEPGEWLDRMHQLYLGTVERAELSLGIQRKEYFRRVCAEVPGAHYVLYFKEGQLIGFNLLVEQGGMLIDKYFCMDAEAGRELNLYFVSWMENVKYCCEKKLTVYHAGPGAEGTKARFGAEFVPSITMFRHRIGAVHAVLKRMRRLIAYAPEVEGVRPSPLPSAGMPGEGSG